MKNEMFKILIISALFVWAGLVNNARADAPTTQQTTAPDAPQELTVQQIVDRTNYVSYYHGADGTARVRMVIVDAQNRQRQREFTILRYDQIKDSGDQKNPEIDRANTGEQKFYVYFHRPADVNKMVMLVWKYLDKDDDRWLYLPSLDLVKRIAGSDKRTSFVGSHFFYEDVSGRNVNADKHELLADESNKDYYVLKNTPKDLNLVEFAYYKMWIHRKSFVVVQTSYYDRNGDEYRRYNALEVKNIQGYPTVVKSRMTDLRDKSYSQLQYDDVKYNVNLDDSIFNERYLRKPPQQYFK